MQTHLQREGNTHAMVEGTTGYAIDGGACGECRWATALAGEAVGLLALAGGAP